MYRSARRILSIIALGLGCIGSAQALDSDRNQPVELAADAAEMSNITGVGVYTGNVVLIQGTMEITGDKMTVHTTPEGDLAKVLVEGQEATFKQLPEGEQEYVHARAPHMEYRAVAPSEVVLTGGALLTQGKNEFAGDVIHYNVSEDLVTARGQENERVKITLFPKQQQQAQPQ